MALLVSLAAGLVAELVAELAELVAELVVGLRALWALRALRALWGPHPAPVLHVSALRGDSSFCTRRLCAANVRSLGLMFFRFILV